MLGAGTDPSKGMFMRRSLIHAAALTTCALVTTGCASLGLTETTGPSNQVAAQKAQSAAEASADSVKLPTNLDGAIRHAQLLRAQGDYAGAIHSLSQLMLVAPDDPRVVGEYGKVLAQEGRSSDALAFLTRAVQLQPNNWTLYSALGVTYDQLGDRTKAEMAYKHALSLNAGEPTVLNNYAMSQMMVGHLDRADDLLHQAAAHGGNYPKIANNLEMVARMRAERARATGGPESKVSPAPTTGVARIKLPPVKTAPHKPVKVTKKTGAPAPLQHARTTKARPRVVMQKVPYDPLAGHVYGHHAATRKTAAVRSRKVQHVARTETKPATKEHKTATPPLRTAADLY